MFGETVRAHRQRLGITQVELARATGISVRNIRNIEAGRVHRPRPATVRLLADTFQLRDADRDRFCQLALRAGSDDEQVGRVAPAPGWPAYPAPAQLPLDVAAFAGREQQLQRLDELLDDKGASARTTIATIAGTAGVGKTALAVHWSHRVRDRFPDGQLYVNLRGFDPAGSVVHPAEAIRGFLDAFAMPPQQIPAGVPAQAALYRSLLAGKRALVLLDNARDADQVRPLLPGSPGCLVVVTSRNQLTGLVAAEGAHPLTLDLPSVAEASELLARRLGPGRVAADPDAVDDIIARCARLPLALAIVAARVATQPSLRLAPLADELRYDRGGLDAFAGADAATDVRTVLSWSYRALSREAARLFRLLGVHPGPDIATAAAASLTGLPLAQARPLLAELTRAHLLTEHASGRYAFHDLLRAYAAELANTHDADTDRRVALHRVLDHYLHTAHRAVRLINPDREPISLAPPEAGVTPVDPADPGQAKAWLTAEHPVLLSTIRLAGDRGFDTHTWQLAWTLWPFFDRQGRWQDWVATQHAALAATRRLADRHGQARTHRSLAFAYTKLGRHDDAETHYRDALDLYGDLGDPTGHGYTLINFGMLFERQGRCQEALTHAQQALDIFRAAEHVTGQAHALNAIGWLRARLGDHEQALSCCQQALALHQQGGERRGEASTWDSLGYVHHHLGHHQDATTCYQHALKLYRETDDRYGQTVVLTHLGDNHHTAGETDHARTAWRNALAILDELGHDDAILVRTKLDDSKSVG